MHQASHACLNTTELANNPNPDNAPIILSVSLCQRGSDSSQHFFKELPIVKCHKHETKTEKFTFRRLVSELDQKVQRSHEDQDQQQETDTSCNTKTVELRMTLNWQKKQRTKKREEWFTWSQRGTWAGNVCESGLLLIDLVHPLLKKKPRYCVQNQSLTGSYLQLRS